MADSPTALTKVESPSALAKPASFGPQTFQEAMTFATYLAKSDLIPAHYKGKAENILVAIQHGAELGLPPIQALNSIAVINGHPGIYGDAALALVKSHPAYEWIQETFDDATMTAKCVVKRRNEPEVVSTFSKDDAKRADLWDERARINKRDGGDMANPSPWYCYPKRMLKFRARGFALRDAFPDALRGIVTAEEVADYPNAIEGQVVASSATQTTTQAKVEPKTAVAEDTIGTEKATQWYKMYRASGWTVEEATKFLKETFSIDPPRNSKDIPASGLEKAEAWAKTLSPIRQEADKLFKELDWTIEEQAKFCNEQKWNFVPIVEELKKRLAQKNSAEQ